MDKMFYRIDPRSVIDAVKTILRQLVHYHLAYRWFSHDSWPNKALEMRPLANQIAILT